MEVEDQTFCLSLRDGRWVAQEKGTAYFSFGVSRIMQCHDTRRELQPFFYTPTVVESVESYEIANHAWSELVKTMAALAECIMPTPTQGRPRWAICASLNVYNLL